VITAIAALAGFDPEPLRAVERARAGEPARFAPAPEEPVVTGYLDAVKRTTHWLDGLDQAGSADGGA
jgi:hypothetical protein